MMVKMEYTYKRLGKEDLALYREMLMLFKAEVPPDERLQAILAGSPESLQIVALNDDKVVGAITAVEGRMPGKSPRDGHDKEVVSAELMERLKEEAHLRGASAIYTTDYGDNRDVPIRVPPLR
jgi:predicted N-acetyltransferase YhbS